MRLLLAILYFLPFSLCQNAFFPPGCGRKNFTVKLEPVYKVIIVGGEEMIKPFPWIVRVGPTDHPCTGSLISKKHVLTAGHCFASRSSPCFKIYDNPSEVKVCHGTLSSNETCEASSEYSVAKIYMLDAYVNADCNELLDIVVVELDREVTNGVPVCLPTVPLLYNTQEIEAKLFVAGYGNNNDFADHSERRTNTRLRFAFAGGRQPCGADPRDQGKICTNWDDKTAAICNGDSGGPLTEMKEGRHVIVGVNQLSLGGDCAFNRAVVDNNEEIHFQAAIDVGLHMKDIREIVDALY